MTPHAPLLDEMHALVAASFRGDSTAEQKERLTQLLSQDVQNVDLYLNLVFESSILLTWARGSETAGDVFPTNLATAAPASATPNASGVPMGVASPSPRFLSAAFRGALGFFPQETFYVFPIAILLTSLLLLGLWLTPVSNSGAPSQKIAASQGASSPNVQPLATEPKDNPKIQYVGRITGEVNCRWNMVGCGPTTVDSKVGVGVKRGSESDPEIQKSRNPQIPVSSSPQSPNPNPSSPSLVAFGDKITVAAGLLEITYDTGARVILEGPCRFHVETNGGFLGVGRLTGKLGKKVGGGQWTVDSAKPPAASNESPSHQPLATSHSSNPQSPIPNPFVIATPTAIVTDLGTEFGVEVAQNGEVDARVFEGRVRIAALGKNNSTVAVRELKRDESVRIAFNDRVFRPTPLRPDRFVRQLPQTKNGQGGEAAGRQVVERDFLKSGVQGDVWCGILNADKASRIDTLPVAIDGKLQHGLLTIAVPENAFVGWAAPHRGHVWNNAPYLYVNVAKGDFEAHVQVKSQTLGLYSVAGLMVRAEDGSFVSVNFNRFTSKQLRFATRCNWRNVDADNWSPTDSDQNIALRLVRMGSTFLAYGSNDNGDTWIPLDWGKGKNSLGGTLLHLPDAAGPVQLGLWYGTFNPMPGQASFRRFIIRGGGF
jgi:hypothetical protein